VNRKTPNSALISVLIALFYGISPLDLIPDVVPLIGLVDDAIIVPVLLLLAFFQIKKSRELKTRPAVIRNRR
jgi:uncharacterized membrane protein YkvA (DUF1232 family)